MQLCQYKNFFGKPNEGAHALRLFNIAIVDLILTFLVAYGCAKVTHKSTLIIFIFLLGLGLFFHWLFCVPTTLTKLVFPNISKS